jgi:hypothetical protein
MRRSFLRGCPQTCFNTFRSILQTGARLVKNYFILAGSNSLKSLAEFSPAGENKVSIIFSAACTSKKIPLSPEVCDFRVPRRENRARAGCNPLSKKTRRSFSTFLWYYF